MSEKSGRKLKAVPENDSHLINLLFVLYIIMHFTSHPTNYNVITSCPTLYSALNG